MMVLWGTAGAQIVNRATLCPDLKAVPVSGFVRNDAHDGDWPAAGAAFLDGPFRKGEPGRRRRPVLDASGCCQTALRITGSSFQRKSGAAISPARTELAAQDFPYLAAQRLDRERLGDEMRLAICNGVFQRVCRGIARHEQDLDIG